LIIFLTSRTKFEKDQLLKNFEIPRHCSQFQMNMARAAATTPKATDAVCALFLAGVPVVLLVDVAVVGLPDDGCPPPSVGIGGSAEEAVAPAPFVAVWGLAPAALQY
jgi:hypothetical protein